MPVICFPWLRARWRAPSAVSGDKPGWGLGLMLVQAIALAHGGSVNVESTEQAGTTFTLDVLCDARTLREESRVDGNPGRQS